MITRRSFIKGIIALAAAPAIVRIENIMPVKMIVPAVHFNQEYPSVTWLWEWGDGTISTGENFASHDYSSPGIYTVRVTDKNMNMMTREIILADDPHFEMGVLL